MLRIPMHFTDSSCCSRSVGLNPPIEVHFMPCSMGLLLEILLEGEGRMAGRLLLQRYLLPQSLGKVCVEKSLSREERKPLPLCGSILPLLYTKGLDVISVGAIFYSEQRSLCVDLVRAVVPIQ